MANKKSKSKKAPRNSYAYAEAVNPRVAGIGPMKSKNTPRGGQKNEQRELLEQAEEEYVDEAETGADKWIAMTNYNCISCDNPTRNSSQIANVCDECGIMYYGDPRYYGNDGERSIEEYQIVWGWEDQSPTKPITIILKDKWFETARQWHPNEIKTLDGWKLFDIRTKEQLEKLLVLL